MRWEKRRWGERPEDQRYEADGTTFRLLGPARGQIPDDYPDQVHTAVTQLNATGKQASPRAVQTLIGGTHATIKATLESLHAEGRLDRLPGRQKGTYTYTTNSPLPDLPPPL